MYRCPRRTDAREGRSAPLDSPTALSRLHFSMPHLTHAGARIWWEEHGEGDPAADHGPRRDARMVEPPEAVVDAALSHDPVRQPRRRQERCPARTLLDSSDGRRCVGGARRGRCRLRARRRSVDGRLHRAGARAQASGSRALARARLHELRRPRGGARGGRGGIRDGRAREGTAGRRGVGDGAVHLRRVDAAPAHRARISRCGCARRSATTGISRSSRRSGSGQDRTIG